MNGPPGPEYDKSVGWAITAVRSAPTTRSGHIFPFGVVVLIVVVAVVVEVVVVVAGWEGANVGGGAEVLGGTTGLEIHQMNGKKTNINETARLTTIVVKRICEIILENGKKNGAAGEESRKERKHTDTPVSHSKV